MKPLRGGTTRRAKSAASTAIALSLLAGHLGLAAAWAQPSPAQAGSDPGASLHSDASLPGVEELDRMASQYAQYWERHPHGQWLLRILPVRLKPSELPEAQSRPARLTARYCVQCHALPDPSMHGAQRWPRVVERMVPRMRGEGNQGQVMHEMMKGLQAPDAEQVRTITAYLIRHAQRPLALADRRPLDRDRRAPTTVPGRPELTQALMSEDGRMFRGACDQCHELPDPASHRAAEWPAIVERMQANMQWMNRVVGTSGDPREPRLDPQQITRFLQTFASDGHERDRPR
jgi:hypothetical protein